MPVATSNPQSATSVPETPKNTSPAPSGTRFHFREVTGDWGLDFTRFDDISDQARIMEVNGGGLAVFDCDLDGRLDLFFSQGCRLPYSKFPQEHSNELYLQRNSPNQAKSGSLQLLRATTFAALEKVGFHTGVAVGDYDSDGFPDLYVGAYGRASLWHNSGDGTFREATEFCRVGYSKWSTSVAFADFNGDGDLDLFVTTYVDAKDDPPMICHAAEYNNHVTQCAPALFPSLEDILFVNNGDGQFKDVSRDSGILRPDGKGLGVLISDLTGDGHPDIYVANDGVASFLFVNETETTEGSPAPERLTPRFIERGAEFGAALNGEGRATAAMGVAAGDYNRDGWTDLYVTNFYLEANTLFQNLEGRSFQDASAASRLGPQSRRTLGFGAEFLDIDHDCWLDLVVTNGHIEDRSFTKTEPYRMPPHLFRNDQNGKFTDVAQQSGAYFASQWVGRALASGDLDRDGDLDLIIGHQVDPSVILLNETPPPATSVIIKAIGTGVSPRNGVGVRISAEGVTPRLWRTLHAGGSFQSTSAQELHLPLGAHKQFEELVVEWPDRKTDKHRHVIPGYYVAIEGHPLVKIQ